MPEKQIAFLEQRGNDMLYWRDGCVIIESLYEKEFRELGGNVDRVIALFEDFGTMDEVINFLREEPHE